MTALILLFSGAVSFQSLASDLCPPFPKAQWVINQVSKGTFTVEKLIPLKEFNACEIKTNGETFFLSKNGREIIEGILLKVPKVKINRKDLEILKRNVLFKTGNGKETVIVATNPLCKACRKNLKKIKKLTDRYIIEVIPVGFTKEEEKAAIDAYCRKKNFKNFFKIPKTFSGCDKGKLKEWTVKDIMKKYGITGTPVFIFPDGSFKLGVENLTK